MTVVYILSDYEEHGAENVCATLDRGLLIALLRRNWPDPTAEAWRNEAERSLHALLQQTDEDLVGEHNLHDGWGGVQLHVVRLAAD